MGPLYLSTHLVGNSSQPLDLRPGVELPDGVRAFPALTRRRHVDYGRVATEACLRSR